MGALSVCAVHPLLNNSPKTHAIHMSEIKNFFHPISGPFNMNVYFLAFLKDAFRLFQDSSQKLLVWLSYFDAQLIDKIRRQKLEEIIKYLECQSKANVSRK